MVLLYFMDGLKYDIVQKHMPFMASLNTKPLKSDFGYSCACHATMYTGTGIDEHGTWFIWKRGDNSPYKWIDKIPFLKYFNLLPVKVLAAKLTRKLSDNTSFSGIPMLVNLPLKFWSKFEPSEKRFWSEEEYMPGRTTLFKALRHNNIDHYIVGLSKKGDVFKDEERVDYSKAKFVYYFIGEVDSYMHKYGKDAPETAEYLKRTDDFIKETYIKACAAGNNPTVMCFSDHGHIEVEKKIDANDYFKLYGLNIMDYIQLTESTFIRFWVRNEKEKNDIEKVLADMQNDGLGFIIDDKIKAEYSLPTDKAAHGDIVFHLNAPNIFTNTIWGYGKTIKSMHGYLPELPDHYGVFASNKPIIDKEFVLLADILPTVFDELKISRDGLKGDVLLSAEGEK